MTASRIDMINEMLRTNPNDPFLHYAAALEYKKIGDLPKATEIMESLVTDHPDYLATYYQLGKLLESQSRTDEAIPIYKKGREVAKKADDLKTLSELSEALMILDEEDGEMW